MPTYVVTSVTNRINQEQKKEIASEITEIHCSETGAPKYFVQIIFNEVTANNYYLGGKPLEEDNIYVHAHIRNGRTIASKQTIIKRILNQIASATDADLSSLQVYISDIPAKQVAEFGVILPEPGEEGAWEANQSPEAKERMARLS